MRSFDELFEEKKILEKLEKNKLEKNELEKIKNFSFELKTPAPAPSSEDLLKEFLEGLDNYLAVERLKYHSPIEEEELRRLSKLRERLWKEVVEKRMKKGIINGV